MSKFELGWDESHYMEVEAKSIEEADRIGVAICKDIIDNYRRHAARLKDKISDLENADRDMRYRNTELQNRNTELAHIALKHDEVHASIVAGLQLQLGDLRCIVRERNHAVNNAVIEHNDHSDQLYTKIEELEARNKELEDDMSELLVVNAIHRRHGEIYRDKIHRLHDAHTTGQASTASSSPEMPNTPSPTYGMRSLNFERLVKGYHGMLSRHGKTIFITLPFEHEIVAINAVEYITGHDEHTDRDAKEV